MSWKKRLLLVAASVPLLFLFLMIWGLIEPYILDEEEQAAIIPNLPSFLEGKKIAQLSDFQVGMWWDNVDTIDESVEKIIEEKPVAVLISGDFIYHASPDGNAEIEEVVDLIRPLAETNIPVYAVLGNHDYGIRNKNTQPKPNLADKLERALEEVGIMVLRNEARSLDLNNVTNGEDDASLYLVGIFPIGQKTIA
ncbi:MAG: metallophosphoesterase [Jaaginema sp. PMC 1079.18]|nr:metallophosphoesterase [Jaaginema sp. PMC 1080.18]MEC4853436.1 metallophosphoesterase [Jaaginema sp. PMC 1079.18]MEC4868548.1 metallophosphoesterase [Jaaginema sp. PMC 1078.18]